MNTIKKIGILCISLIALLYLPGCFIDFDDDDDFFGCVNADGPTETQVINMATFDAIDLRIAGQVYISQGDRQRVEVMAPRRLLDELEFDVRNREWRIRTDRCTRYSSGDLKIYITLPNITGLKISGSGDIISENILNVDDLNLRIGGSGSIDLGVNANNIAATIGGSGNILLEGQADVLDVTINGSGDFQGFELQANRARISIGGSGNAEVRARNTLEVKIGGSGNVRYKGNPTINTRITGSGRVINAN